MNPELSDEEIQRQLEGEIYRGPRTWRAQPIAPLSRGLRALRNKVVAPEDSAEFHDVALLQILAGAHAETHPGRLEKRRALIVATDDVTGFRATISLLMDELSDQEIAAGRQLTNEILGIVEKAEVVLAEKKTGGGGSAAPSPIAMPSPSGPSPESPAIAPISSAGN